MCAYDDSAYAVPSWRAGKSAGHSERKTSPSAHQGFVTVRVFTQRFSSTPLGARLARLLTLHQLHGWGIPHGTRPSDTAALIVAELAANAATHGRDPGRDFELRLTLTEAVLRVEVSDRAPVGQTVRAQLDLPH